MHGLQTNQQIRTVLVVEDSYHLAQELMSYLQGAGYSILTAASLESSFDLIHETPELDAAILDVNLGGALVFPVADELAKLKIPFFFATGYSADIIPPRFADRIFLEKPLNMVNVTEALSDCKMPASLLHAQTNIILSALGERELSALSPSLKSVTLRQGDLLEDTNGTVNSIYFVESGVLSLVAVAPDGTNVEAGLIGREGLTGTGLLDGDWNTPFRLIVQMSGNARRIETDDFLRVLQHAPRLRSYASSFSRSLSIQMAFTALANAQYPIVQRLARWLLMLSDRQNSQVLDITHKYMSIMLGVRRSGVTNALHVLEGEKLIRSVRGKVVLVDRDGLIAKAGGSYGVPEREYRRLMGFDLRAIAPNPVFGSRAISQLKPSTNAFQVNLRGANRRESLEQSP